MAQVARNFVREEVFPQNVHEAFLRQLIGTWQGIQNDPVGTRQAFVTLSSSFVLNGPSVTGTPVAKAGRVAAYAGFKRNLEKTLANNGIAVPSSALEVELRALSFQNASDPTNSATLCHALFRSFGLTRSPAWCTFLNPLRATNPYVSPRNSAKSICEHYGLGMIDPPEELAIFTYTPTFPLLSPTIADANTYHFFRPSRAGSQHGWTFPLRRFTPWGSAQPEAVHEGLTGDAADLHFSTVN